MGSLGDYVSAQPPLHLLCEAFSGGPGSGRTAICEGGRPEICWNLFIALNLGLVMFLRGICSFGLQ